MIALQSELAQGFESHSVRQLDTSLCRAFFRFLVVLPEKSLLFLDNSSAMAAIGLFHVNSHTQKLARYCTAFQTSVAEYSFFTSPLYQPQRTALLSIIKIIFLPATLSGNTSKGKSMPILSSFVDLCPKYTPDSSCKVVRSSSN